MNKRRFLAALFVLPVAALCAASAQANSNVIIRKGYKALVGFINIPGSNAQLTIWDDGSWERGDWDGLSELGNYPDQIQELMEVRRRNALDALNS